MSLDESEHESASEVVENKFDQKQPDVSIEQVEAMFVDPRSPQKEEAKKQDEFNSSGMFSGGDSIKKQKEDYKQSIR